MERQEIEDLTELKVRQYCDELSDRFAKQVAQLILVHNSDVEAHGSVEKRLDRAVWVLMGVAMAGGGAGAVVTKVLGFFA